MRNNRHENRQTSAVSRYIGDRSGKAICRTRDMHAVEGSDCAVVPMKLPNKEVSRLGGGGGGKSADQGERCGTPHEPDTEFTATATTELIMFAAELDPRTPGGPSYATDVPYVIDNATLTDLSESESSAIPEPATLLACASGLAALMRGLPRRKARTS